QRAVLGGHVGQAVRPLQAQEGAGVHRRRMVGDGRTVTGMATWQGFCDEAPELAQRADERFEATGLVLVATLRRDGWPRISPVEAIVVDGQLYLGMMPGSMKSIDLRRDERVLVHSTVTDKDGKEGEAKLYGTATEITDPD